MAKNGGTGSKAGKKQHHTASSSTGNGKRRAYDNSFDEARGAAMAESVVMAEARDGNEHEDGREDAHPSAAAAPAAAADPSAAPAPAAAAQARAEENRKVAEKEKLLNEKIAELEALLGRQSKVNFDYIYRDMVQLMCCFSGECRFLYLKIQQAPESCCDGDFCSCRSFPCQDSPAGAKPDAAGKSKTRGRHCTCSSANYSAGNHRSLRYALVERHDRQRGWKHSSLGRHQAQRRESRRCI